MITIKPKRIKKLAYSGHLLSEILDSALAMAKAGVKPLS